VKPGENCSLSIGQAQCGDLQTCVAYADGGAGACRAFCAPSDPSRGCAADETCVELTVGSGAASPSENVCVPRPSEQDADLSVDGGTGGQPDDVVEPPSDVYNDIINPHQ
jgi:hypothetical protein